MRKNLRKGGAGRTLSVRLDAEGSSALDAILDRHKRSLAERGVPGQITPSTVVRSMLRAEAARLGVRRV